LTPYLVDNDSLFCIQQAWTIFLFSRLILLFLLCASNLVWSANTIAIIDNHNDVVNIAETGYYFIDDNKTLSLDAISSDEYSKRFRPINSDYLRLGIVKGNVWVRTDIAIQSTESTPILLEIKSPRVQYLDIFLPSQHEVQAQVQLGNARPYNNRNIKAPNYLFTIPTNMPPVFTVYIKLSSHLPMNAGIELKTLSKLSSDNQKNLTVTGTLIGILLTLFISNLFFYVKSSHPMYLIYSFLLVGIAILHLALHDQFAQFFPNIIGIQERIYNAASLFCLSSIVFFSRLYLDTKRYFPTFDNLLLAIGSLNIIFAFIFTLSPESISIIVMSLLVVSTLICLTVHAIISFIKNVPFSGYYLTARSTLLIGHFFWVMSIYGIIPSATLLEWGLTVTIIIEALIHFTGMIVQTTPLLSKHRYGTRHSQTETFDLLADLSSRLRRQINIIGGGLTHLEQAAQSPDTKTLLTSTQTANNNIKSLIERIDCLSDITDSVLQEQGTPIFLNQLIDNAHNNFQRLDQDNTLVEFNSSTSDQVEILQNAPTIQHLLEVITQEFKHFTDQVLTINITHHDISREGVTILEINCYPLPTRVHESTANFDFGMGYIALLIQHLKGEMRLSEDGQVRSVNIKIPIRAHVRHLTYETKQQHQFHIILFGQEDEDLQKTLTLLQSNPNQIEHFSTLESMLEHLESPVARQFVTIILVFDNGGHIPHITQQRLTPLMRNEDQCLLISNNIKMSLDYAKKLGFDDILACTELEQKFTQQLSHLIQKGDRLKNASLSRVNSLRKTP
jgi:hypothetical protein